MVMVGSSCVPGDESTGKASPRGGEPVWSGPVAATKEESTRHGRQPSDRAGGRRYPDPTFWAERRSEVAPEGRFVRNSDGHSLAMTTRSRWAVSSGRGTAARVITGIGALFALIEVVYILLILFGANQANQFFQFVKSLAEPLALFFPGLFKLANNNLETIVNYGLAAVFWVVVAGLIARLVSR
ncbi:MAG TPA: hypothetical protein VHH15_10285 [Actinophytocola sp.]|nr:hypothetical protein [Actinophytocola sp.]